MSAPLKIWMIAKWYPNRDDPQFGVFIQKHALAIAREHRIGVLYVHAAENMTVNYEVEEKDNNGVRETVIYFRKNHSPLRRMFNLLRYVHALRLGRRLLRADTGRPDVVHGYILLRSGLAAWYFSRIEGVPYVISEQWSGFLTGKFLKSSSVKKVLTRYIVKKAAAVSSVSAFLFNRMKECGLENGNYHIIPNIIEIPERTAETKRESVSVLVVADLVDEIKNISGLIRMIASLPGTAPFHLRIIGRGPDEEKLKGLAEQLGLLGNKIFFEGLKSNREVYDYLQRCDFLVMNSWFETFSLICAEAMSCGKPVLATRCGGPNEFVNEETGILTEPGDTEGLKKNFLFMLSNHQNFDPDEIRNHVKSLFSMGKVGKDFLNFYQSAVRNG